MKEEDMPNARNYKSVQDKIQKKEGFRLRGSLRRLLDRRKAKNQEQRGEIYTTKQEMLDGIAEGMQKADETLRKKLVAQDPIWNFLWARNENRTEYERSFEKNWNIARPENKEQEGLNDRTK